MLRYGDSDAFSSINIFRYMLKGSTMGFILYYYLQRLEKKVQVGKDQEKAQSEKDSHSKLFEPEAEGSKCSRRLIMIMQ